MKVRLRARARRDLTDILDYSVARHGDVVAETYLKSIDAALDLLRGHPMLGQDRSDRALGLRSYPVGEHRIYYLALTDRLSVVRILHKAMDAGRHV